MKYILLLAHLALAIICVQSARTRLRNTLEVNYNLGCQLPQCQSIDPDKTAVNLFQVISTNPETPSNTNFIWSTIGGPPMVIITNSSQESNLNIDWNAILNANDTKQTSGFHFNVTQDAALGLLIEKLILFDDTNKSGTFTPSKPYIEFDWAQILWGLASKTTYNKDDFLKTHLRMKANHKYLNGNILVKLAVPRNYKADRQTETPHLKLSGQSISIDVTVDGIQAPANYKNPRLTMTFVLVVQSPNGQVSLDTDSESLISDEYTPGVFRIKSLQFKSKQKAVETEADRKLGFLYWKEVAYTDRRKIISRRIDVVDGEIPMPMETLPSISQPFYQFFTYEPPTGTKPQYSLYRFELIFGKGESSYSATNYTDFSFVFGLGAAPQEPMFSFLVKATIFVCFCLPLLVMLAALAYLMVRRFRRNGDTELLLAAES